MTFYETCLDSHEEKAFVVDGVISEVSAPSEVVKEVRSLQPEHYFTQNDPLIL